MNDPIKINPKIQSLIPPLRPDELLMLEESIRFSGCREPLVVWRQEDENVLLDGHNRYAICKKHHVAYFLQTMEFEGNADAEKWVLENQLARRNLTDAQRAEVVLRLKPAMEEEAKVNKGGRP